MSPAIEQEHSNDIEQYFAFCEKVVTIATNQSMNEYAILLPTLTTEILSALKKKIIAEYLPKLIEAVSPERNYFRIAMLMQFLSWQELPDEIKTVLGIRESQVLPITTGQPKTWVVAGEKFSPYLCDQAEHYLEAATFGGTPLHRLYGGNFWAKTDTLVAGVCAKSLVFHNGSLLLPGVWYCADRTMREIIKTENKKVELKFSIFGQKNNQQFWLDNNAALVGHWLPTRPFGCWGTDCLVTNDTIMQFLEGNISVELLYNSVGHSSPRYKTY